MKKSNQSQRRKAKPVDRGRWREIFGLFFLGFAVLTALALATYQGETDASGKKNILGVFGADISYLLIQFTFGRWPSFIIPILLLILSGSILFQWKKIRTLIIGGGLMLLAFWISFTIGLAEGSDANWTDAGFFGAITSEWMLGFMGNAGSWIVWSLMVLIGSVLLLRLRPSLILKALIQGSGSTLIWMWDHRPKKKIHFPINHRQIAIEDQEVSKLPETTPSAETLIETEPEEDLFAEKSSIPDGIVKTAVPDKPVKKGQYQLPSLSLLDNPPPESPDAPEELKAKAKRLQEALSDFGVGARVVRINPGPVITRFDLEPDPGVKVSRISALADDLALVLRARAIRIQAPIPGQGAVGVEIPNRRPSTVALKSVAASSTFMEHPSPLAIALGDTASGEPYVSDLGIMPHLLVAGTTGSGKSVCLNAIIASLLLRNPPEKLQLVIIDPKKLELSIYARLARHHLLTSPELDEEVITTAANAVRVLGGVEIEMGRRYDILASVGARNVEEFNKMAAQGKAVTPEGEIHKPLNYLVIVIDELADLMILASKEVEEPIARLAQMARAVGIHLIVATQRPSVDVITGVIKANFPTRLAFQVASKIDSRTILDINGAEALLGNGDALFIPPGRGQPERIHCCYVGPSEIDELVTHIENQPDDFYRQSLKLPQPEGAIAAGEEILTDRDELFEEAARMVIHQGQASVSILQRRLKIGYARAGRLIDQLERAGVVGPFDGSKAREVLMDEADLESLSGEFPPIS